jgi:hypothetical protein
MSTDTLKTAICDALATWIRQRPGLEFGNYGNMTSYRSEMRSIAKDKRDAETLLQAVRWRDSITGEKLQEAFKHAFSGRLKVTVKEHDYTIQQGPEVPTSTGWDVELDYTTGQYWPTEYRKAAAAVLASALWEWQRDSMPKPDAVVATSFKERFGDSYDGKSAGDWLRRSFRKEFGSALQRRWFN